VTPPSGAQRLGTNPVVTIRGPDSPEVNRRIVTTTTATSTSATASTTSAMRLGRTHALRVIELLPYELKAGSIQRESFNGNHHGVTHEKSAS
jgi:hypothetical protein